MSLFARMRRREQAGRLTRVAITGAGLVVGTVTQANDATTTSYAGNDNVTGQKVEQDQFALVKGVVA